jgi:hypothetical protein
VPQSKPCAWHVVGWQPHDAEPFTSVTQIVPAAQLPQLM